MATAPIAAHAAISSSANPTIFIFCFSFPSWPLVRGREKRRGRDFRPRFGRGPGKAYGTRERKCAQSRRIPCIADFHVELSRFRPSPSIAQNAKDFQIVWRLLYTIAELYANATQCSSPAIRPPAFPFARKDFTSSIYYWPETPKSYIHMQIIVPEPRNRLSG